MQEPVTQYFETLNHHLKTAMATGRDGMALTLNEGLELGMRELVRAGRSARKVMFVGNGGSAGIASHQATDYMKNGGFKSLAFNDGSLLTCLGNDYGFQHVFEKSIERFADKGDVLIAISSSGKSENILRAAKAGKAAGCFVITMSGFGADNPLRELGDLNLYVPAKPGDYGYVEISHLALSHAMLETIIWRGHMK